MALSIREQPDIEGEQALGGGHAFGIRHLPFPNALPPLNAGFTLFSSLRCPQPACVAY